MPEDALVPAASDIYACIEEVCAQGVRRPGYPADAWAVRFCAERFRELGLERVRLEPFELHRWEPRRALLRARTGNGATADIACFPLPHAASATLDVPLAAFDRDEPGRVAGAASLYDVSLLRTPYTFFSAISTWQYDPHGTFEGAAHLLPFGREIQHVMEPSIDAGAAAFIGALTGYPAGSREYYVPYDGLARPIPGVWVSGSDGARLRDMLARGPVDVHLEVDADRRVIADHNVVGELPGADDDIVIVGSHHDGPWASAVEDGSGIALVLAQAAYWSRVPRERRPHRMLFLLNAGHMCGGAGARAFVEAHAAELERTVLEVHLEHAALEHDADARPTGLPEARWWFTSRIASLEQAVRDTIEGEDLQRSFILPPTALGPRPTTDGSEFYVAGVPIVNFLAAPFYLFDSMDTPDKIDREGLVPITRAAIRILESTAGVAAREMRAAAVV